MRALVKLYIAITSSTARRITSACTASKTNMPRSIGVHMQLMYLVMYLSARNTRARRGG
jgi:hypothetical protein